MSCRSSGGREQLVRDGVLRPGDADGVLRIALPRLQRALEQLERPLVLALLRVGPAQVVEERAGPVRGVRLAVAELDAALRPLLLQLEVVDRDRAHVRGVAGEVPLLRLLGAAIRRLEERERGLGVAA